MNRTLQEKKVKAGLADMSAGGLGDTLEQWNDSYFQKRGLFVHLELSQSATKNQEQKSKAFRKQTFMYGKEDRDRKREERKFILVVTKLDEEGQPSAALQELAAESAPGIPDIPEMATEDAKYNIAEMLGDMPTDEKKLPPVPGDEDMPVELPTFDLPYGASIGYGNEKFGPPVGYAELDSDTTALLEKTNLNDKDSEGERPKELMPKPLMTT